jgi:hypothetical protein
MKTKYFFYYLAVLAMLFTACNDDLKVKKEVFGGYAQKGPFVNGSSVTISELNANLDQTGRTYSTSIVDNSGRFEQRNIELVSNYVELKANGFYFNEIWGVTSMAPITLYALADVKDINSVNINVLTHLEKPRVEYLVKQEGKSFSEAKKQAQREVLAIFGFEPPAASSEVLNLTDNAALLAISCILQGNLSTGDIMELMADIAADIRTDGALDNTMVKTRLIYNAYTISSSLSNIRNNLTVKYVEFGKHTAISDFESSIRSFLDRFLDDKLLADFSDNSGYWDDGLYPQSHIIYPTVGTRGWTNLLQYDLDYVKIYSYETVWYSMRADIKEGHSLKIVLKGGTWTLSTENPPVNWNVSPYDSVNKSQEFTAIGDTKCELELHFKSGTLDENGKPYITVEYYENSSATPTKVKKMELYIAE